jgi:hypothetical protein
MENGSLASVGRFPQAPAMQRHTPNSQQRPPAQKKKSKQKNTRGSVSLPRLEDLVAPASVDVQPDSLWIDRQEFLRIYSIDLYPRAVEFGWIRRLIEVNETIDIVQHLAPQKNALSVLQSRLTHRQALALARLRGSGKTANPQAGLVVGDLMGVVEEVSVGAEDILESAVHVMVRARTKAELEDRCSRIQQVIYATFQHRPRVLFYEQRESFLKLFLPGSLLAQDARTLPAKAVATTIPFHGQVIFHKKGILEGVTPGSREPVVLDWWKLSNASRIVMLSP